MVTLVIDYLQQRNVDEKGDDTEGKLYFLFDVAIFSIFSECNALSKSVMFIRFLTGSSISATHCVNV